MTSLSFPDINVWLALASSEHVHARLVRKWWHSARGRIAFSRFTQISLLRIMTTSAAMDGKPLTMVDAWKVYERFFADDRVTFLEEPASVEQRFRELSIMKTASPKM